MRDVAVIGAGPAGPTAARTLAVLVVATLAWGALAFGAVYSWAYIPLLVMCATLGLAGLVRPRQQVSSPVGWPLRVSLLVTALAVSVQLVPLSPTTLLRITPATDRLLREYSLTYAMGAAGQTMPREIQAVGVADTGRPAPHPLSVKPEETKVGLAFLLSLGVLLFGLVRILRRRDVLVVVHGVIVLGVVLAFIGLIQKATFNGKIYGFWQPWYVASPFGPFVNYNHFAGWMLMALPLAIGCLCGRARQAMKNVGSGWRERFVSFSSPDASQATLIAAGSLIMALSLFLTMSRSGMVGFVAATAILGWFVMRRQTVRSRQIVALGYLLLLSGLSVGWVGATAVVDRFAAVPGSNLGSRLGAWQDAVGVIADFPFTGTGLNTYGIAMFFYQQHDLGSRYLHAHNDYLQIAAEGGLLVALPALVSLLLFARAVRQRFRERHPDPTMYWLRVGAVTGLVAIGLQETVDFSLQIPGNATLFTVLCAIALSGGHEGRGVLEHVGPRHCAGTR